MISLTFEVTGQNLTLTNTRNRMASDTVNRIEADFVFTDTEWEGLTTIKAYWEQQATGEVYVTPLDENGHCVVPWEVVDDRSALKVNLVGTIIEDGYVTDRITTFQAVALNVTKKINIEGSNGVAPTTQEWELALAAHAGNTTLHTNADEREAWNAKLDDAPADDKAYGRKNEEWVEVLEEAPYDDNVYGRRNGEWVEVIDDTPVDNVTIGKSDESSEAETTLAATTWLFDETLLSMETFPESGTYQLKIVSNDAEYETCSFQSGTSASGRWAKIFYGDNLAWRKEWTEESSVEGWVYEVYRNVYVIGGEAAENEAIIDFFKANAEQDTGGWLYVKDKSLGLGKLKTQSVSEAGKFVAVADDGTFTLGEIPIEQDDKTIVLDEDGKLSTAIGGYKTSGLGTVFDGEFIDDPEQIAGTRWYLPIDDWTPLSTAEETIDCILTGGYTTSAGSVTLEGEYTLDHLDDDCYGSMDMGLGVALRIFGPNYVDVDKRNVAELKVTEETSVTGATIRCDVQGAESYVPIDGRFVPIDNDTIVLDENNKLKSTATGGGGGNAYTRINQCDDYLFEVQYTTENIDQEYCYNYFTTPLAEGERSEMGGACTGVYYNLEVLRHYDWTYDNCVDFLVRRTADRADGKYASVGLASALPAFTKEFVGSGEYSEKYKLVPFAMCDGINECGMYIQQNVTPKKTNDIYVEHTGSEYKGKITTNMIGRIVLDNCASVDDVLTELAKYDIYRIVRLSDEYDLHWLLADSTGNHGVLEFSADGTSYSIVKNGQNKDYELMTNFSVDVGITPNTLALDWNEISDNDYRANGLERWELCADELSKDSPNLETLRPKLMFTNAYKRTDESWTGWLTEWCGTEYETGQYLSPRLAKSEPSKFDATVTEQINLYNNRSRDDGGKTWQTVHSVLYNLPNKTMELIIQERIDEEVEEFALFDSDEIYVDNFSIEKDEGYVLHTVYGGGRVSLGITDVSEVAECAGQFIPARDSDYEVPVVWFHLMDNAHLYVEGQSAQIDMTYNDGAYIQTKVIGTYDVNGTDVVGICLNNVPDYGHKTIIFKNDRNELLAYSDAPITETDSIVCESLTVKYEEFDYTPIEAEYIPYSTNYFEKTYEGEIEPKVKIGTIQQTEYDVMQVRFRDIPTLIEGYKFEAVPDEPRYALDTDIRVEYYIELEDGTYLKPQAHGTLHQQASWYEADLEKIYGTSDENVISYIKVDCGREDYKNTFHFDTTKIDPTKIVYFELVTYQNIPYDEVLTLDSKYVNIDEGTLVRDDAEESFGVRISAESDNKLEVKDDGLYVEDSGGGGSVEIDDLTLMKNRNNKIEAVYGGGKINQGEDEAIIMGDPVTGIYDESMVGVPLVLFEGMDYYYWQAGNKLTLEISYNGTSTVYYKEITEIEHETYGEFDAIEVSDFISSGSTTYFTFADDYFIMLTDATISSSDTFIISTAKIKYTNWYKDPMEAEYIPFDWRFFNIQEERFRPNVEIGTWEEEQAIEYFNGAPSVTFSAGECVLDSAANTAGYGTIEVKYVVLLDATTTRSVTATGTLFQNTETEYIADLEGEEGGEENIIPQIKIETDTKKIYIYLDTELVPSGEVFEFDYFSAVQENAYVQTDHKLPTKYVEVSAVGGNAITIQPDGLYATGGGDELTSNKVTSVSAESTDTQYPSAKCLYTMVGNIESLLEALL